MDFFISSAYAQSGEAAGQPSAMFNLVFFGGFALIFYFLIWRPQSKRSREHRDLMSSLNKGDEVMTNGGILGKLTKVDDNYIVLQIADNVEIKLQKSAISAVLPKGTLKSI
jgi:preprotein translocase subunit YajC